MGNDIINSNRKSFSSVKKMKNYKYGLIDYSNIPQFNVSNSEIEIIASHDKKTSEYISGGGVAIAAKEDLGFGLNRMWEIIVENAGLQWETMVFRAIEDAKAWVRERVKEKYEIDDLTFG